MLIAGLTVMMQDMEQCLALVCFHGHSHVKVHYIQHHTASDCWPSTAGGGQVHALASSSISTQVTMTSASLVYGHVLDVFIKPQIWVDLVQTSQAVQQAGQRICALLLGVLSRNLHPLRPGQHCWNLMIPATMCYFYGSCFACFLDGLIGFVLLLGKTS